MAVVCIGVKLEDAVAGIDLVPTFAAVVPVIAVTLEVTDLLASPTAGCVAFC